MTIRARNFPKPITSYEELAEATAAEGGLLTLDMVKLRDIHGAGKLGVHVVQNISDRLDGLGLGHQPDVLPQQQWERVRIYSRGSPVGRVIEAAHTVDDKSDAILREIGKNDADELLKKIRELVCD
jgi:hypothetical protein